VAAKKNPERPSACSFFPVAYFSTDHLQGGMSSWGTRAPRTVRYIDQIFGLASQGALGTSDNVRPLHRAGIQPSRRRLRITRAMVTRAPFHRATPPCPARSNNSSRSSSPELGGGGGNSGGDFSWPNGKGMFRSRPLFHICILTPGGRDAASCALGPGGSMQPQGRCFCCSFHLNLLFGAALTEY